MSLQNEPDSAQTKRPQSSFWLPALSALALAVGGFSLYQSAQINNVHHQLEGYQRDIVAMRAAISDSNQQFNDEVTQLRQQIASSAEQNGRGIAAVRSEAGRIKRAEAEQHAAAAALREQLDKVQQDSAQTAMRVNGITSDVSAVKDQVGSAHSRIDQTNSAMQSMRGDLGVMSGLIATNQSEIEQLRKLGDRNIYEFTLHKRDGQQKVGDIQVRLERVNAKRNRYTVVVNADDKLIEKKDKTTNEPVQFYVISKARQPYELVVNEVGKDTIKGYLATPKIQLSRAETAAAQ